MILQLKIVPAKRCSKQDITAALDIYCKSTDPGSWTDTNQICDHIWNSQAYRAEPRQMFFYLLYDNDGTVEGFSEFAYLPENRVLVLDYLCTRQRNHVLFYNFYHMVVCEIQESLKKEGKFIQFLLTELSLTSANGQLIDIDSNYFRHLLSNENYKLLKYPYYQPPLLPHDEAKEFNLAIAINGASDEVPLFLSASQYLSIVKELYISHYLAWYKNYPGMGDTTDKLIDRIAHELVQNKESYPIALVQCKLFDEGQCPKITVENITLERYRKKKWKRILPILIWSGLAILTFIVCVLPIFSNAVTILCSFLTILAGVISVVSLRNDFFGA
ncbi:hypothetical protein [Candidatus Allofournierella merdavium]|uniref:hypothetical protein n=1 Tax=Candidatus Allofournierella merdavium TaxID=2838593 RepID=UPI00374EFCD5